MLDTTFWRHFIHEWSIEVLEILGQFSELLTPTEMAVANSKNIGFAGSRPLDIEELELRIGQTLPASYKKFLLVSDGCRIVGMDATDGCLLGTSKVNKLSLNEPDLVEDWMDVDHPEVVLIYGEPESGHKLRLSYLPELVAISDFVDSKIYVLNFARKTNTKEVEALILTPQVTRFESFYELMIHERAVTLRNLRNSRL